MLFLLFPQQVGSVGPKSPARSALRPWRRKIPLPLARAPSPTQRLVWKCWKKPLLVPPKPMVWKFGTEDLDRFGTFFQHMCKDNFWGPMIRHPYGEWLSFWVNPQMSLVIPFCTWLKRYSVLSCSQIQPMDPNAPWFITSQICTLPKFNMEAQEGHVQCWNHFKTIFLTFHAKLGGAP